MWRHSINAEGSGALSTGASKTYLVTLQIKSQYRGLIFSLSQDRKGTLVYETLKKSAYCFFAESYNSYPTNMAFLLQQTNVKPHIL